MAYHANAKRLRMLGVILGCIFVALSCAMCIVHALSPRRVMLSPVTLKERLQMLEARYEKLERAFTGDENLIEMGALARLKLDKARLMLESRSWWWSESEISKALDEAELALNAWEAKRDILKDASGLVERAYFSPADGSAQPYWVYVPKGYKPTSKHPLVVFLHGYDPSINKANPWLLTEDVYRIADKHNFIILQPHGRKNTDFINIGEQDVLIALERTMAHYSVDEDRVFLLGVSMGGYGAYIIALHHPHKFAAVAAIAARRYHFLWGELDQTTLVPPRAFVLMAENPYMLAENAINLPILIMHGEEDLLVPVANAFLMSKRLASFGCPVRVEILRKESHWIYFDSALFEKVFSWFEGKRRQPFPKRVVYHTFTTAYNQAYWITIHQLKEWCKRATVRASVLADGRVFVNTSNVARLTLDIRPELVAPAKKVNVIVNGASIMKGDLEKPTIVTYGGSQQAGELAKVHNLCGPVWHAYMSNFIIAYGTNDRAGECEAKAKQLADEWVEFSDGVAKVIRDRDVTEEQIKRYNIIAVGGPNENSFVRLIADKLPVQFLDGGYRVGKHEVTRKTLGKEVGIVLVYPNPLNQSRYVVIYDGVLWGSGLPINHKFDTLPDFVIFTEDHETDGANEIVCGGFFDTHWQVDENLIWCKLRKCQGKLLQTAP